MMKTKINNIFKNFFMFLLAIFLLFLGGLLADILYIGPFFIPNNKFLADPFFIISFLSGASIGFFLFAPVNFFHRLFRGRLFKDKIMFIVVGCFSIAGFFANIAVYQYVIKPKEMIICPREFGYKKNLMRFYVTDLSLCKSD